MSYPSFSGPDILILQRAIFPVFFQYSRTWNTSRSLLKRTLSTVTVRMFDTNYRVAICKSFGNDLHLNGYCRPYQILGMIKSNKTIVMTHLVVFVRWGTWSLISACHSVDRSIAIPFRCDQFVPNTSSSHVILFALLRQPPELLFYHFITHRAKQFGDKTITRRELQHRKLSPLMNFTSFGCKQSIITVNGLIDQSFCLFLQHFFSIGHA